MPLKSYILTGTAKAGSQWTQLDTLTTPSGKKRKFIEARIYCSQTADVKIRLNVETEVIHEFASEVINAVKYPYPMDLELSEGQRLILEAMNAGASDAEVIVEVICEEARGR